MVATVVTLGSASSTVGYYARDGFHQADDPAHHQASRWFGRASQTLGLCAHVDPHPFAAVLAGRFPVPDSERQPGRVVPAGVVRSNRPDAAAWRHPGLDITFSAPKSVSLTALLEGDLRVLRAHDKAVRATLHRIEATLLFIPVRRAGERRQQLVPAPGMVAATFRHTVNRNLDPQLHTHAVVANLTVGPDLWEPLALSLLRRNARLIGSLYRNELAQRLGRAGFVIIPERRGRLAAFEIAGWSERACDVFSSRRNEINRWIGERGWSRTTANMRRAALATRQKKNEPAHRDLMAYWRTRAFEHGLAAARERTRAGITAGSPLAAVFEAAILLGEREPVSRHRDLLAHVLAHAPGQFSPVVIEAAISRLSADGHLEARLRKPDAHAWAVSGAAAAERDVIRLVARARGRAGPVISAARAGAWLDTAEVSEGQCAALRTALLGCDRVVGIQVTGAHNTADFVRHMRALVPGRRLFGLFPVRRARGGTPSGLGVPIRSLDCFLGRIRHLGETEARKVFEGGIVFLAGASRTGPIRLSSLVHHSEAIGIIRLVLVAETRHLGALDAGQTFRRLAESGMTVARVDDRRRRHHGAVHLVDREDPSQSRTTDARIIRHAMTAPGHRMDGGGTTSHRRASARILYEPALVVEGSRPGERKPDRQHVGAGGTGTPFGQGLGFVQAALARMREVWPVDLRNKIRTGIATSPRHDGQQVGIGEQAGPAEMGGRPPGETIQEAVAEDIRLENRRVSGSSGMPAIAEKESIDPVLVSNHEHSRARVDPGHAAASALLAAIDGSGLELAPGADAAAMQAVADGTGDWLTQGRLILDAFGPKGCGQYPDDAARQLAVILIYGRALRTMVTETDPTARRHQSVELARHLAGCAPGPMAESDTRLAWRTACGAVRACLRRNDAGGLRAARAPDLQVDDSVRQRPRGLQRPPPASRTLSADSERRHARRHGMSL